MRTVAVALAAGLVEAAAAVAADSSTAATTAEHAADRTVIQGSGRTEPTGVAESPSHLPAAVLPVVVVTAAVLAVVELVVEPLVVEPVVGLVVVLAVDWLTADSTVHMLT